MLVFSDAGLPPVAPTLNWGSDHTGNRSGDITNPNGWPITVTLGAEWYDADNDHYITWVTSAGPHTIEAYGSLTVTAHNSEPGSIAHVLLTATSPISWVGADGMSGTVNATATWYTS